MSHTSSLSFVLAACMLVPALAGCPQTKEQPPAEAATASAAPAADTAAAPAEATAAPAATAAEPLPAAKAADTAAKPADTAKADKAEKAADSTASATDAGSPQDCCCAVDGQPLATVAMSECNKTREDEPVQLTRGSPRRSRLAAMMRR